MKGTADSPVLWVQIVGAIVVFIEIALVVMSIQRRYAAIDAARAGDYDLSGILFDESPKLATMAAFASIMPFVTLGLPGIAQVVEGEPDPAVVDLSNDAAIPLAVITGVMLLGYFAEMKLKRWWAEDQAEQRAKRAGVDA